jgi:hypothetical protein
MFSTSLGPARGVKLLRGELKRSGVIMALSATSRQTLDVTAGEALNAKDGKKTKSVRDPMTSGPARLLC